MNLSLALPAWPLVLALPFCLLSGVLLGVRHFGALWRQAQALATGDRPKRAAGLAVLRFLGLAGSLVAASLFGALPLLALAFGVLIGRSVVMRRVERAAP
ncbi:N-ATPase subunit AtpR [Jiella marina]|uniref:N-ATPase subunit AtpR n=1 Tax=Jiella sp. LLJ827 TaxID=2917712 RepID=UPI002100E99E|nr:ATP synthase subunit I [Jiella sp. LLJ827]MCQ0989345.1 ATP synthase subunit I [Jiella sp. LLJ827]